MGYHVNGPVKFKHSHFIDYAIEHRSDFMDIFLSANCRFFLGTTCGLLEVPALFDTPIACTNRAPFGETPLAHNTIYIPKKLRISKSRKYVNFHEFPSYSEDYLSPALWHSNVVEKEGLEYEDNTPEDILDLTIEMMQRLDNSFEQNETDRELLDKYYNLFPPGHLNHKVKTPIGRDFLRKNQKLFFP